MKDFIFIFGSAPEVSLAELRAVVGFGAFKSVSRECAIATLSDEADAGALQSRLGGTVKIGSVLGKTDKNGLVGFLRNILEKENKFIFGISVYSAELGASAREFKAQAKNIGLELKKEFRSKGVRSRFAASREDNLSTVAVAKNKLIASGAELLILAGKNFLAIGKTLTVQDFEKYNLRDYGRPAPAPRSGMLPPKLAQMMINISRIKKHENLLDPFCGSGTVLQEGAFLGIENIIGSDKDAQRIGDSQKNLSWFQDKFKIRPKSLNIFQCDAAGLSQKIPKDSIDAIITEPYLGPPLTGRESFSVIQKNRDELEKLYGQAFQEFAKVLKPNGTVVFVFPRFPAFAKASAGKQALEIRNLDQIKKSGFGIEPLSPDKRGSVIYQKDIQHVVREIFVFKLKKE